MPHLPDFQKIEGSAIPLSADNGVADFYNIEHSKHKQVVKRAAWKLSDSRLMQPKRSVCDSSNDLIEGLRGNKQLFGVVSLCTSSEADMDQVDVAG